MSGEPPTGGGGGGGPWYSVSISFEARTFFVCNNAGYVKNVVAKDFALDSVDMAVHLYQTNGGHS